MSPPKRPQPSIQGTPTQDDLPGCPCGFSAQDCNDLRDTVEEMRKDIADIRTAVIGHEQFGHRGLISRMSIVERTLFILSLIAVALGGERIIKLIF